MKSILILILLVFPAPTGERLMEVVCKDGSVHIETFDTTEFECEWSEIKFF